MSDSSQQGAVKLESTNQVINIYNCESLINNLFGGRKVSWYHASNLDGRPIMLLRALMNWDFGDDDENRVFRTIGLELRNTMLVYNDNSKQIYEEMLEAWKHSTEEKSTKRIKQLFRGIDCTCASIIPFRILAEAEHNIYFTNKRDNGETINESTRKFDGFMMRLPWFRLLPDLCDTVVFFCMDDFCLKNLFDKCNIEVVAFFEHNAGHEGSPGFSQLYKTAEAAHSIKYIFTDWYNYCVKIEPESYILCNSDYPAIWHLFKVFNLVSGRKELSIMPALLPEHKSEDDNSINGYCDKCKKNEDDLCGRGQIVAGHSGFGIAIRKNVFDEARFK